MRPNSAVLAILLALTSSTLTHAAPADATTPLSQRSTGPAKEALAAFEAERYDQAIELATPLAAAGDPEALYLLGFAHENGRGVPASRTKALDYYRQAVAKGQKDATYRFAFILLTSEDEAHRNEARTALEAAAKTDPAVPGRILGEAWLIGRLSKDRDYDQAVHWWTTAGNVGDTPSLLQLARLYEGQFGFEEKKDLAKAYDAYKRAANLGDTNAMVALGSRLLSGPAEARNEAEGREWLNKAAAAKEYSAYLALGDYEENVKNDPKAALETYRKGDDAGQLDCTLRTAEAYLQGRGTAKDEDRGIKLLEKAATAGSSPAHLRLAVIALTRPTPDLTAGYRHLTIAATAGHAEAQNELALFYLSQKLGFADPVAAVAWLTRSAQAGFAPAQNNLATMYERGAGVQQNTAQAGKLYGMAANQGHPGATYALARMLVNSPGTTPDLPKAWALAKIAADLKNADGAKLAADLEARFTPEQKARAIAELEAVRENKPLPPEAPATPATQPAVVQPPAPVPSPAGQ